jgi:Glycosyltransferase family 28 C-terminal domain
LGRKVRFRDLKKSSTTYDLLLITDVTRKGDAGLRIAREVHTYFGMGLNVGILHLGAGSLDQPAAPDIQKCVRDGLVEVVPAGKAVRVKLAVVHAPGDLQAAATEAGNVVAEKVVLVHDRRPIPNQMGLWLSLQLGPITWAPTNRWIRAGLENLAMPVPLLREDWRPIGCPVAVVKKPAIASDEPVFGRISVPGAAQWPTTSKKLAAIYPLQTQHGFRAIGGPPDSLLKELPKSSNLDLINPGDITAERFIETLDVFFYFPSESTPLLPAAAIATAMASGKLVVLPPHLEPLFGPGAIYSEAGNARGVVAAVLADEDVLEQRRASAILHANIQFSAQSHRQKILDLLENHPPRKRRRAKVKTAPAKVLFVPSNGVGLGHATRLLAIARRLDSKVRSVFATLAQAAPIIENFGYLAEYIPSAGDTGVDPKGWDIWFRHELETLIDRHDPGAVVFDGNNPTPGLIRAAQSRARRLVWVRRGMMGHVPPKHLDNARFMDLIIEPGEIAAEWDTGPTSWRREEALVTDPITLLDRKEVLPRGRARKALGLARDDLTVLVHLGAGLNRDAAYLIGDVVENLKDRGALKLVIAEWENSPVELPHWPGTLRLRGFPLSRYFNAFDFSISAAGYNSYHEGLAFGLPTIFIANRHPAMDDQGARAEFAQHHSAGFDLREDELFQLPALCEAMRSKAARTYIRQQGLKLSRQNGAATAANAILDLIEAP